MTDGTWNERWQALRQWLSDAENLVRTVAYAGLVIAGLTMLDHAVFFVVTISDWSEELATHPSGLEIVVAVLDSLVIGWIAISCLGCLYWKSWALKSTLRSVMAYLAWLAASGCATLLYEATSPKYSIAASLASGAGTIIECMMQAVFPAAAFLLLRMPTVIQVFSWHQAQTLEARSYSHLPAQNHPAEPPLHTTVNNQNSAQREPVSAKSAAQ